MRLSWQLVTIMCVALWHPNWCKRQDCGLRKLAENLQYQFIVSDVVGNYSVVQSSTQQMTYVLMDLPASVDTYLLTCPYSSSLTAAGRHCDVTRPSYGCTSGCHLQMLESPSAAILSWAAWNWCHTARKGSYVRLSLVDCKYNWQALCTVCHS